MHSSRVLTPKRHHSESVLYLQSDHQHHSSTQSQTSPSTQSETSATAVNTQRPSPNHRHNTSYPPVHNSNYACSKLENFAAKELNEDKINEAENLAASKAVDGLMLLTNGQDAVNSYRSNHRLFPVSTYTEPVHSNTSQYVLHPKPQFSSGLQKPAQQQQQQQQAAASCSFAQHSPKSRYSII